MNGLGDFTSFVERHKEMRAFEDAFLTARAEKIRVDNESFNRAALREMKIEAKRKKGAPVVKNGVAHYHRGFSRGHYCPACQRHNKFTPGVTELTCACGMKHVRVIERHPPCACGCGLRVSSPSSSYVNGHFARAHPPKTAFKPGENRYIRAKVAAP